MFSFHTHIVRLVCFVLVHDARGGDIWEEDTRRKELIVPVCPLRFVETGVLAATMPKGRRGVLCLPQRTVRRVSGT